MAKGRVALLALAAALVTAATARAEESGVVLLPTVIHGDSMPPTRTRREDEEARALQAAARQLDLVLSESVQDLGLTLDLAAVPRSSLPPSEEELVARAGSTWVVAPEISLDRGDLVVRIAAVAPGSQVVLARRERFEPAALEVGAMRLVEDLVAVGSGSGGPAEAPSAPAGARPVERAHSPGRAVLALHGALLGGYAGYSVQRASGSDDVRLTYPLTALGAGVGLGASMIVTDEWDVGVGDAWFLAAGIHWPGAGGLLLARGYEVEPVGDRYLWGLLSASGGLTLATVATGFGHVDLGGAALAHSGGLFGTLFGGMLQAGLAGSTTEPVHLGLGYGALGGVVLAGAAATQFEGSSSRVLFVDLVAGLGGLSGAALGSPLMVGDQQTAAETRGWLGCIALGTTAGAVIGTLVTRSRTPRSPSVAGAPVMVLPYGGVVAAGTLEGAPPFLGAGLQGSF